MKVWSWKDAVTSADLESNTKFILLVLSLYMDSHGQSCFPTIDRLVKDSSLARGTVIKHLDLAEEAGFIKRRRHGFAGQKWANNEYIATYPAQVELKKSGDEADEKGGSTSELPSGGEADSQASPAIEPAFSGEGGSTEEKSQSNGSEKVVQPLDSNTSIINPIPHQQEEARAGDDSDADADEFIKILDEEGRRAFGENHDRPVRIDDPSYAREFIKMGCTPAFFRETVRAKLGYMAQRHIDPPAGMAYFKGIIPAEMRRVGFRATASTPRPSPSPAPASAPLENIEITLTSLGGDTPENRNWLKVLERLRGWKGEAMFRSWLAPLRISHQSGQGLFLTAPTKFMAEFINQHHYDAIKQAISEIWPEITIVKIEFKPAGN